MKDTQVITRRAERCVKCGAIGRFVKTCGTRINGVIGVASARCKGCGHRAQIRVVDIPANR